MKYIPQRGPTCLLAAICQIDESLDYERLCPDYEDLLADKQVEDPIALFLEGLYLEFPQEAKLAKAVLKYWKAHPTTRPIHGDYRGKLTGKGIVILSLCEKVNKKRFGLRHAISFEDGKVLDSTYGETETLDETIIRMDEGLLCGVKESDQFEEGWKVEKVVNFN